MTSDRSDPPGGEHEPGYGDLLRTHKAPAGLLEGIANVEADVDGSTDGGGLQAPVWAVAASFLATFFLGTTIGLLLGRGTLPTSAVAMHTDPGVPIAGPAAIPASFHGHGPRGERATVPVRMVLHAPEAGRVSVAGSWNNWDPNSAFLAPAGNGTFSTVLMLEPGVHEYMFVVDGKTWVPDPSAPISRDDGFGSKNSVLEI